MWTDGTRTFGTKPYQLVAAVFFDDVTARDAIADLKLAGLPAGAVGVALSEEGKRLEDAGGRALPSDLEGKHSVRWKLRRSFEHDLHSHGPDLSTTEDLRTASRETAPFTEIDLEDTLLRAGVFPATIKLLQDRMGPDGMLILVDAGERVKEVESILVQNRGMLRTVMATEQPQATS